MSLNLVSPGVKVREVDLTVGRIDNVNDQVGAIAGPFARGPIGVPVLVETTVGAHLPPFVGGWSNVYGSDILLK